MRIELVFRQGEALIEKSEPLDTAVIEEELEDLQRYYQEVFGRVDRYYKKLTRLPVSKNAQNNAVILPKTGDNITPFMPQRANA